MNKRLAAALAYAKRNVHVFPLKPGEKTPPSGFSWPARATTDEAQIRAWWKENPDYNVGVAAGPSGLVIVDLDNKNDKSGSDTWRQLHQGAADPDTFVVMTPTGGYHLYFAGDLAQSSVGRVGDGIDIRSAGGYVVGAGSATENGEYRPVKTGPFAVTPEFLKPHLSRPREKQRDHRLSVELDQEGAVSQAKEFLKREPGAIEGAGGDLHTFKVACRLIDYGLSIGMAHSLLSEWNDKCSPPWDSDDLMAKARNAWAYRQKPVGVSSPDSMFEGLEEEEERAPFVTSLRWIDGTLIPPRRWVLGRSLLRGKISMTIADGGTGKSTYALQCALSVVTGNSAICGQEVHERVPVLIINNEDDLWEQRRRLAGAQQAFNIRVNEITERLHLYSGVSHPFQMAVRGNNGSLIARHYAKLKAEIVKNDIGVVIFDPLVELHEGAENDNGDMRMVMSLFRQLAVECDVAVQVIHHTHKLAGTSSVGHTGNMHSGRGATAVSAAARIVQTMYGMSQDDAKRYGIQNPYDYARLDDAKANMSAKSPEPKWFEKQVVEIANGDAVAVFHPVTLVPIEETAEDTIATMLENQQYPLSMTDAANLFHASPEFASMDVSDIKKMLRSFIGDGKALNKWYYRLHHPSPKLTEIRRFPVDG